ncbi:Hypothetical protein Minf_1081 [Methylacidiphilum infernorum V4]|uniref:Uncharacterized protein n=1 Tax=Methylacidiphilum infernorum (isolate V4) TaxID=481448 RepID=B3DUY3_METI4|nr:Hypothetical protein Minf_1081 [Methylacidiphilum infernorum V4]
MVVLISISVKNFDVWDSIFFLYPPLSLAYFWHNFCFKQVTTLLSFLFLYGFLLQN